MTDFLEPLRAGLQQFGWQDAVDILIVAIMFYVLIKLIAKTRAVRMVIGLGVVLLCARIFEMLGFVTVTWLFTWILNASAVLIVVLFQPEIRRALERLGRAKVFGSFTPNVKDGEYMVEQFTRAILNMAKHKVGAILVFERKTGLADVIESGTALDANVSAELIENLFYPNTPLHDGAMIIRDGRIAAAGCFLPLSDNKQIATELGTRHRAALGVSEVSDAYVLVVSEESGTISFMHEGVMQRYVDAKELKNILSDLYITVDAKDRKAGVKKVDLSAETKEINTDEINEAAKEAEAAKGSEEEGGK